MRRGHIVALAGATAAAIASAAILFGSSAGGSIDVIIGGTPTPTGCPSATPYTAGSADQWGGCWPGPTNTGVPPGTSLTTYAGSCTITTANTVIDSKTVNCEPLLISTSGVQISKSQINGQVAVNSDSYPNPYSFTITDSEVNEGPSTGSGGRAAAYGDDPFGVGKSNFTATRVYVHGGIRAFWCEYDCTVQDSYGCCQYQDNNGALTCVDPVFGQNHCLHESGLRQGSGPNATEGQRILHNTLACDAPNFDDPNPGGSDSSGCSAPITGYGDFATIQFNTVDKNLIRPTEGGNCYYGGFDAGKNFPNGNHQTVTNNVFVTRAAGGIDSVQKCGFFFSSSSWPDTSTAGNIWTNNQLWNGTTLASLAPNT